MTRGGKREGAGRPRIRPEGDRWVKLTISLTTTQAARLREAATLAGQSVSAYARRALGLERPER